MAQAKNWVFTQQHPTPEMESKLRELHEEGAFSYIIWGRETAPTTGTSHLQGYFQLPKKRCFGIVRELLPFNFLAAAKGDDEENRKYCSKSGTFVELGTRSYAGKRTDLAVARQMVEEGCTRRELLKAVGYQAAKHASLYAAAIASETRRDKVTVHWYWGVTGSGKSHRAHTEALAVANGNPGKVWFGDLTTEYMLDYTGQPCAIFDDVRPGDRKYNFLLRLLDHHPMCVKSFGEKQWFIASHVWVTSSMHPEYFVPSGEDGQQLMRRITVLDHSTTAYVSTPAATLATQD